MTRGPNGSRSVAFFAFRRLLYIINVDECCIAFGYYLSRMKCINQLGRDGVYSDGSQIVGQSGWIILAD